MFRNILSVAAHLVGGFLVFVVVTFVAVTIDYFATPGLTNAQYIARGPTNILFLWFFMAMSIMIYYYKMIRIDWRSFLLRQVFLWVPILLGWFLLVNGYDGSFQIGAILSSAVLIYQVRVWWRKVEGAL